MLPGWTRIAIAGKPADVFDPPRALPFALLFLHPESGETPATDPTFTAHLAAHRLRCIAPHAGRSWWVDRVYQEFDPIATAEQFLRTSVLGWIESTWKLGKRRTIVAGIEMGGQGAVRLGFKYPLEFPVVASISGAFDFHERYGFGTPLDELYASREQCRQDTAILHVPTQNCPQLTFACSPASVWFRGNDRLHEKLSAMGIDHSAELDCSEDDSQLVGPMLAFALAAMQRELRRLS